MKNYLRIVFIALTFALPQLSHAGDYHWLTFKMLKLDKATKENLSSLMKNVKKGDVITIPINNIEMLCDFSKSIVSYRDNIKREVASCEYTGEVRTSIK